MKRLILAAGLCLLLTACDTQKPIETVTLTKPPATTPTPDTVLSETFTPNGYSEDVTVTVFYDPEHGQNRVEITQNGAVIQTILEDDSEWRCAQPSLTVEDMNFDGIPDFRFCYATYAGSNLLEHVYLYDYDYETGGFSYRKAAELDESPGLNFDAVRREVCSSSSSVSEGGWTLFKWTDGGFALRREGLWMSDADGARTVCVVRDRAPWASTRVEEKEPAISWTELARWESGENTDPEEALSLWLDLDYFGEEADEAPSEIPRDLLDFLTPRVTENIWRSFAQQYAAGQEISYEDAESLWSKAGEGETDPAYSDMVCGLRVDADNDGSEDLFLYNSQGTGHFHSFYLLQNGAAPTEQGLLGNRTAAWFVSWAGNHYLLVPWYDYDTRAFEGLNVWLFREGKGTRRAWIQRTVSQYDVQDGWAAEGYEDVYADLKSRAAKLWADFDETWTQSVGTAERRGEGENNYLCDWNNDGREDVYSKYTTACNAAGRYLSLSMEGADTQSRGYPWQSWPNGPGVQLFWVDRWPVGNLICTADGWSDGPIRFAVYQAEGEAAHEVANLTLRISHQASVTYQGPDCDFDWY